MADDNHLNGCMIALMPTAEDAARLRVPGGEAAGDLHLTLHFLGEADVWDADSRADLLLCMRYALDWYDGGEITANIFGVAHWNGGSPKPAWVWNVGSGQVGSWEDQLQWIRSVAICALEDMHRQPELPEQHCPWVPHICAVYSPDLTLVRNLEKRLGPVTFDRLRVSFGSEDHDFPLKRPAVEPVTAAATLRRQVQPHEAHVNFAEHDRQWTEAVNTTTNRLHTELADWRRQIREQIAADPENPATLAALHVDTRVAADVLHEHMLTLAEQAGRAVQREAEAQGVRVPEWKIPDDAEGAVTAALGGQELLRGMSQMTADLMASNMVQSAKRFAMGLLGRRTPGAEVAAEVDAQLSGQLGPAAQAPVKTAMSTAQTLGRVTVLRAAPEAESYTASEVLDKNTCKACIAVDGTVFTGLEAAISAYPVMGYAGCAGSAHGNPCRGFIVANWGAGSAATASAAILRPNAEMIGEGTVPWHKVHNHSGCPDGKPWAVVKDADGSVAGCHANEGDANDQLAALYANSPEASVTTEALKKGEPSPGTKKDKRLKENQASGTEGAEELAAKDCPPGMTMGPDGKCMEMQSYAGETAPATGAETAAWRGPLTVEGIETGDGREFDSGALTWADLPLPLRWNRVDSHGGEARTEAVNVGRIDRIWREDSGLIMGEGVLDLGDEDGRNVQRKIKEQMLRGVSVDVDSIKDADMELVWPDQPDGEGAMDDFDRLFASPEKVVFHKGRIRAATLVDIPAFAEAYIALLDEAGAVVAGGTPVGSLRESRPVRHRTLGVRDVPARPSRSWFENPDLSVPTGITVTPEGRVYGHAALWGTCHIGQAGMCVTPPQEESHPYFMTGAVWTEEGDMISVGQITLGTGHADISLGYRAATEHYDNTGTAVADVAVGNDAHGIWVAGAIRPGTAPERIHELRASGQVSGDWRNIGGNLRLVGLLAVNVPGFPVPKLRSKYTSGQQLALVAAGLPVLTEGWTDDDLDQWAYARIMSRLGQRVHAKEK